MAGSTLSSADSVQYAVLEQHYQGKLAGVILLAAGSSQYLKRMVQRGLTIQFLLSIGDQGRFNINLEDEVVRRSIITHNKEVLGPAPPAPAPPTSVPGVISPVSCLMPFALTSPEVQADHLQPKAQEIAPVTALTPWQESVRSVGLTTGGMGTALALGKLTGPAFMNLTTVLGLAGLVGFRAVWSVSPALHSPLMCKFSWPCMSCIA